MLITEGERSKKARYFLNDTFFHFCFHFVKPNRSAVELGTSEMNWNDFNTFMGRKFEEIAKELLTSRE
ncbi:hypothetical protein DRN44_04300 [Thermococci archaeon]|nr:MAG: hypothetical protein DRN44_04300 [Thermococci archaeon]